MPLERATQMQKYLDVTVRIPVADDFDEDMKLTLASEVRQTVKDNLTDLDEVLLVSVALHTK